MKITLACIVGNEEAVIERFIRSFAPAVDEFVFISATGLAGKDSTLGDIFEICAQLNKVVRVASYTNEASFNHVDDFGKARQMAWNMAINATNPDFLLWADADDILATGAAEAIRAAADAASHDVFIMPYHVNGDKQVVMRERMVRASIGSYWQYPIHEQLAFPADSSYKIIKDAVFIHSPLATKSGGHLRNVAILENEVRHAWRNFFYLSQEYFQQGDDRKFLKYSAAALACPGLGTLERYEILMNLAQTPNQDSRKLAAEAFATMPDRREALALLCSYSIIDKDYPNALTLARKLMETDKPTRSYWSQNNEWYGWKGAELYRQCLRLTGDAAEADLEFELNKDESRPVFSIIHATLGRPEQALQIREMWLSRARCPENVEYIFGLHSFDATSVKHLSGFKHAATDRKGSGCNYDTAAGASTGTIIVQAQDDCYPPDGWDDDLLKIVGNTSDAVFVACGDGHRADRLSANTIITRAYMDIKASRDPGESGFFHRGYVTVYPDTENSFRAINDAEAGVVRYVEAPQFVIYHDHPAFNPGKPVDDTYRWENAPENYEQGAKLFMERNPTAKPDSLELVNAKELQEVEA